MTNSFYYKFIKMALEANNFVPISMGTLSYSQNCIHVPIILKEGNFFFKFFFNYKFNKLESEIKIVEYYLSEGIPVLNNIMWANKKIFSFNYRTIKCYFHIMKNIGATNNTKPNIALCFNIVKLIAKMHSAIIRFDNQLLEVDTITDYQNLVNFYLANLAFFEKVKLNKVIDDILNIEIDDCNKFPIHSDLRFENMVFKNNEVHYLIDFSDLRISYLEDDLGRFIQYVIYTKNAKVETLFDMIKIYEDHSKIKLSIKNIKVSIVYHIVFRFFHDYLEFENKELLVNTNNILHQINNKL